jgi:uncharacterized membrane protein YsdA (DUF1294 family)
VRDALPWILGVAGTASLLAFLLFAWDKRQARQGRWRVPESRLHLLEALGGWPGSLLAASLFHHKTQKRSYRLVTFAIVALHVALAVWLLTR